MRFRHDSDERACGKAVGHGEMHGPFACLRTADHDGECIALACDAAAADGVCFGCRMPLDGPPRIDCERRGAHA